MRCGFISCLKILRADVDDRSLQTELPECSKYELITEILKILRKNKREQTSLAFAEIKGITEKIWKTFLACEGKESAWWEQFLLVILFHTERELLDSACVEVLVDLVFAEEFEKKQIDAKYRNSSEKNTDIQKPQKKNIFPQDLTFQDVCETYYMTRLLLSMDDLEQNFTDEFESLLLYMIFSKSFSVSNFPVFLSR